MLIYKTNAVQRIKMNVVDKFYRKVIWGMCRKIQRYLYANILYNTFLVCDSLRAFVVSMIVRILFTSIPGIEQTEILILYWKDEKIV